MSLPSQKGDSAYLDLLSGSVAEKGQLSRYLQLFPEGVFIDIGPGGGEVVTMLISEMDELAKNDSKYDQSVIALDFSQEALDSIIKRSPHIATSSRLRLVKANACNMPLKDNEISGINLSDVLHEIGSYGEGIKSIKEFIKEAARVLKMGGVVILRDPEGADVTLKITTTLRTPIIRKFFYFFIGRYYKTQVSDLGELSLYRPGDQFVRFYDTHGNEQSVLLSVFTDFDVSQIDFTKDVVFLGDAGIAIEVAKHFITFAYTNTGLLTYYKVIDGKELVFEWYERNQSSSNQKDDYSTPEGKLLLADELLRRHLTDDRLLDFVKDGFYVTEVEDWAKLERLEAFLAAKRVLYEVDAQNISVTINSGQLNQNLDEFLRLIGDIGLALPAMMSSILKWSSRENGESYFYSTPGTLISWFAEESIQTQPDGEKTVLVPISTELNYFIERPVYSEIVNYHFSNLGRREGKRVIHFQKMLLSKGIEILNKISQELGDVNLEKTIIKLKTYV